MAEPIADRIAVVFDFDDTLLPDSTTAAVSAVGLDPGEFWGSVIDPKVAEGWDPTLAWMDEFVRSRAFDSLTSGWLTEHGQRIGDIVFPGVDGLFDQLRSHGAEHGAEVSVHVVSSGLELVIEACSPIGGKSDTVHACTFEHGANGRPVAVKRALTFTEKTRCLFEISKGIDPSVSASSPYLVNERNDSTEVPFANMIFVGDGLTDVPAFSMLNQHGGIPIGVSKHDESNTYLVKDQRVSRFAKPDYTPGSPMRSHLEAAIEEIAGRDEFGAPE